MIIKELQPSFTTSLKAHMQMPACWQKHLSFQIIFFTSTFLNENKTEILGVGKWRSHKIGKLGSAGGGATKLEILRTYGAELDGAEHF